MRVNDLMTTHVASVRADETASAALKMMWDCDCGSLPVVDGDARVLAIVTDRDIAMTALFRNAAPSAIAVSEAMSKNIHYCAPGDNVAAAEQIMRAHQIRRLPVLDGERRLMGVITLADLVRGAAGRLRRRELPADEVNALCADICSPRSSTPSRTAPTRA
jgi:CBS domain-containing protein